MPKLRVGTMKTKREISDKIFSRLETELNKTLKLGLEAWPLPSPPFFDKDFPPNIPSNKERILELGVGLLRADKGMFDRHLNLVVDLIIPHRMNLSDDPLIVHERWLLRRLDTLTERLQFAIVTEWLSQALDASNPDIDRWWLSIVMINGLCRKSSGQPLHQGYHLVESISLGERPGTWHTKPDPSNANIDWNPHSVVPRNLSVVPNDKGVLAAKWIMDNLSTSNSERRTLLIEWCRLLLEREPLIEALDLSQRLIDSCSDADDLTASKVVLCLPKLAESDSNSVSKCIQILMDRKDLTSRRAIADALPLFFRRIPDEAIQLFESMIKDRDENILAAVSSSIGEIKHLDRDLWANKIDSLCNHPSKVVRRNLVHTIRDYLGEFSEDSRGIIPKLWADGDEAVLTRLRELMIRMDEMDADRFSITLRSLEGLNIDSLWTLMSVKNEQRATQWQQWLAGEGDKPVTPERPEIHVSDMNEGELPELDDALNVFADVDFLD